MFKLFCNASFVSKFPPKRQTIGPNIDAILFGSVTARKQANPSDTTVAEGANQLDGHLIQSGGSTSSKIHHFKGEGT